MLLGVTLLAVFVKLDFIRDEGGGGDVLWRKDEAYLFMYDRPIGYRLSILEYLLEPLKEHFYAPATSADDKWILTVLQVAPAGGERHVQESKVDISSFTPIDGEIYATCPGGVCKWTGTWFQLVSDGEQQKVGGEGGLINAEFSSVNGWSKRLIKATSAGERPDNYELSIKLDDQRRIFIKGGNPISVDFLRANQPPERVWYHEQRTRRVSAAEYEHVFRYSR